MNLALPLIAADAALENGRANQVLLGVALERGRDFERCTFEQT